MQVNTPAAARNCVGALVFTNTRVAPQQLAVLLLGALVLINTRDNSQADTAEAQAFAWGPDCHQQSGKTPQDTNTACIPALKIRAGPRRCPAAPGRFPVEQESFLWCGSSTAHLRQSTR
jgi:hypothetical protein